MQSPDSTQTSLRNSLALTKVRELPCIDSTVWTKHFFMAGFLKSYNTTSLSTRPKYLFKATNETSKLFFFLLNIYLVAVKKEKQHLRFYVLEWSKSASVPDNFLKFPNSLSCHWNLIYKCPSGLVSPFYIMYFSIITVWNSAGFTFCWNTYFHCNLIH